MARLSHLLITLPLMAAPVMALGLKPLAAATATPIEALELLARGRAVDGKCKTLPPRERDELSGYLARAEVATTARYSVDEAKTAILLGRRSGEVAPCGPVAAGEVRETLFAAREAMAQANSRAPSQRSRKVVSFNPRDAEEQPVISGIQGPDGLRLYARHAMAYYVERRCRHLSPGKMRDYWRRVVGSYRAAVNTYGAGVVARAQKRAESEASTWGCGARSVRLVETSYIESRRL